MDQVTIHVEAEINSTETEQKVREEVENMFGPMSTQIKPLRKGSLLQASTSSQQPLTKFYSLLSRERIRVAARTVLMAGMERNRINFCLNKQVAYAGHVSFSHEAGESPLGPIKVEIRTENPREVVDYLTRMG
jgi:predicted RNA binding protein with dsRBD fold (UPF0201 family)